MTVTSKPSIAELQQSLPIMRHPDWVRPGEWEEARDSLIDAAPILLSIAAAALAFATGSDVSRRWDVNGTAADALAAALGKVRP